MSEEMKDDENGTPLYVTGHGTWLEALQDFGWKVVRYGDYFTDSDGRNPDRYVVMLDTDGKIRKNLESSLMEPFDG